MTKRAIVSVAVGKRYEQYGRRLVRTLEAPGRYADTLRVWFDRWPGASPTHRELNYAFKYHAIRTTVEEGYELVMWLDAACHAVAPIEPIWSEIERRAIYVVASYGPVEPLGEWVSDQALVHFGVSRDEAMKLKLSGGCIVGLDMRQETARAFYRTWGFLATQTRLFRTAHSRHSPTKMRSLWIEDGSDIGDAPGLVLSEDPRVKGHRSDEACFSLMLRELGVEQVDLGDFHKCILSDYNLP